MNYKRHSDNIIELSIIININIIVLKGVQHHEDELKVCIKY